MWPLTIYDGQREIQITADLKDPETTSAPDVMGWIRSDIMPEIQSKYPTVTASYEGQNRERLKLMNSLNFVGLAVLFMIYITIAFTFRSFSQPLLLLLFGAF